jgi:hypothetical protein
MSSSLGTQNSYQRRSSELGAGNIETEERVWARGENTREMKTK